jgi:predicted RNA-binding Zn ribbon-like protein
MSSPSAPVVPFLFVGNDTCLDFLNTFIVDQGQQFELIQSLGDLLRWQVAAGLLAPETAADLAGRWHGTAEAAEAATEARALRARLVTAVDELIAGVSSSSETIDMLNALLQRRVAYEHIVPVTGATGDWAIETRYAFQQPRDLLAPLAHAAAVLLTERERSRIRKCENPVCVLHFFDTSKNGSRRWHDTRVCGNRIRVAHHYQRQHAQ